ncbi:hypothetical protein AYO21_09503 [Fonsecaea monophora]|uniref:C2H2-type domain-containing protein n=1 Tax=Fonsecaea monophora TaxID=254056 RepID=A0A177EWK9_9EURO|nr:hypothetical protein AYO21_09503 [Fonsecaea monophora]OAG36338.1 hypothetical protein AYO21_09503 [Fonsecaea monophora]
MDDYDFMQYYTALSFDFLDPIIQRTDQHDHENTSIESLYSKSEPLGTTRTALSPDSEYRGSGYRAPEYQDSGNRDSGYSSSGYRGSGYSSSGNRDSGYSSSGYRGSGYSSSGYLNSQSSVPSDVLPLIPIKLQLEEIQVPSPAPQPSPPSIRNTKPQNVKTKPRYVCPVPSCLREYVRKSYYDNHIKSKHPDHKLPVETDPTLPPSLDAEPEKDAPDQRDLSTENPTPEEHFPEPPDYKWFEEFEEFLNDGDTVPLSQGLWPIATSQQSIIPTPSQLPSSLALSWTNSSNSPWFESDGEASFVAGDNSVILTNFSDVSTSTARLASLASRLVTLYLGQTAGPRDGGETSSQTSPSSSMSSQANRNAPSSSVTTSPSIERSPQKRPRPNDKEDESRKRKVPRTSDVSPTGTDSRLLACPYSKFDPARYSERNEHEQNYRGCSSCFLKDIPRLKQHLYRVHRRPEHHCPTCFSSFDSKVVLDAHIVERSCQQRVSPFEEKMTQDQLMAIKRREIGRTRSDAWFGIYKILFPNSPLPLDPYVDSMHADTVQNFIAFFERDGRVVLASEINQRMFGEVATTPAEQDFVDRVLAESINVLLQRLNSRFRQPSSSDTTYV